MHNKALWALTLALVMLVGCRESPSESPPIHLNPNMDDQAYLEAQEPNEVVVDGHQVASDRRAMRTYPDHTVPVEADFALRDSAYSRGYTTDPAGQKTYLETLPQELYWAPSAVHASLEGERPQNEERLSEAELMTRLVERGEERYDIYCSHCHGSTGTGDGTVPKKTNGTILPPSYHSEAKRVYPMGQIYNVITNGLGNMPALKSQIPVRDRWAIAVYVKTLQHAYNVPYAAVPGDVKSKNKWGSK